MDTQSRTSGHLLIAYFIGATYYRGRVILPTFFNLFGPSVLWILVAFAMVAIPLISVLLVKLMERVRRHSLEKIAQLNNTRPLLLINKIFYTLFIICNMACLLYFNVSFFTTYYFPTIPFFVFIILIITLTLFATHYGLKSLTRISVFTLAVTIITTIIYIINPSDIKWFAIIPQWPQPIEPNAWVIFSFMILIYFFEPISFLLIADASSTKFTAKKVFGIAMLFSIISSYFAIRETWEFGLLIKDIRFPFFESWRTIILDPYIKQIDFIALLYWILSLFQRLLYSTTMIDKLWQTRKIFLSFVLISISSGLAYFLLNNSLVFLVIHYPLITAFTSLIAASGVLTLVILIKGGKKIDAIKTY